MSRSRRTVIGRRIQDGQGHIELEAYDVRAMGLREGDRVDIVDHVRCAIVPGVVRDDGLGNVVVRASARVQSRFVHIRRADDGAHR